ncbi:hypothetical protein DCE79_06315 [Lysinibacillus sp. 2017]|nr:hypothetical protein DCE79_06315 [Lysinibacillus sp. 2017]
MIFERTLKMEVWKEIEIQEMALNQHFLDFPLNIVYTAFYKYINRATIVLFKIMQSVLSE